MRILDFADGFTSNTAPSILSLTEVVANQAVTSGGEITFSSASFQVLKVSGSGGAVTASATPFGVSSQPADGALLFIMGTDATNTVKFTNASATAYGFVLNGDAVLGEYEMIKLYYDSALSRYIEIGRNF